MVSLCYGGREVGRGDVHSFFKEAEAHMPGRSPLGAGLSAHPLPEERRGRVAGRGQVPLSPPSKKDRACRQNSPSSHYPKNALCINQKQKLNHVQSMYCERKTEFTITTSKLSHACCVVMLLFCLGGKVLCHVRHSMRWWQAGVVSKAGRHGVCVWCCKVGHVCSDHKILMVGRQRSPLWWGRHTH